MPNTRQVTLQKTAKIFLQMLFWIPVAAFSLLLLYNTIPYFSFSKHFSFIEERSLLFSNSFYNNAFYIHIFAGAICILTALIQFSRYILKKSTYSSLVRENLCVRCIIPGGPYRFVYVFLC